jgi:hypothetical protein
MLHMLNQITWESPSKLDKLIRYDKNTNKPEATYLHFNHNFCEWCIDSWFCVDNLECKMALAKKYRKTNIRMN